jgi:hypothetical protein
MRRKTLTQPPLLSLMRNLPLLVGSAVARMWLTVTLMKKMKAPMLRRVEKKRRKEKGLPEKRRKRKRKRMMMMKMLFR